MNRLAWGLAAAFLTAATPSPSPSLDKVLAPAPAGFTELTSSPVRGHFTAEDYASGDPSKRAATLAMLQRDGFVDGYGGSWINSAQRHALFAEVLAFSGGKGARSFLLSSEAGDKANPVYQHPDTISGIDTYYGEHIYNATTKTYGDGFGFVKGNDAFVVVMGSPRDDTLASAVAQAKAQYDLAPSSTIPPDQWPENATTSAGPTDALARALGSLVPIFLGAGFVVAAILIAVAIVLARRRARSEQPAMAGVSPAVPQLSPDGNFWWDGQAWRDAAHETPPYAQRTPDGMFWWDGRTWRPVANA